MASIDFIAKRIDGKKAEIAKLEKRLERINKAKASDWVDNPYFYTERDLKWANMDLANAKAALADYEAKMVSANEKAASRNVKAILDFLDGWKNRVFGYYREGLEEYYAMKISLREMGKKINALKWGTPEREKAEAEYKKAHGDFYDKCHGYYDAVKTVNKYGREITKSVKVRDGELEYIAPYNNEETLTKALARLDRDLTEEANRKYDFIIERVNCICGTITDASGLRIGAKGDLNGIINGERGNASVNTIGAGGYNIQCYHFRTLIHDAK